MNLKEKHWIFFNGSLFLQIGIVSLIILICYNFSKLKKTKRISWEHVMYIGGGFCLMSLVPLEFGIFFLIWGGQEAFSSSLVAVIIGGFVLLSYFYLYHLYKKDSINLRKENPTEIRKIEKRALKYYFQEKYSDALYWYEKKLKILLQLGLSDTPEILNIMKRIENLKVIIDKNSKD